MKIPVSTKVEKAWYVDPEKYVKDAEEAAKPIELTEDLKLPRIPDLAQGDIDLGPAPELPVADEPPRPPDDVALEVPLAPPDEVVEPVLPPQVALARPKGPGLGPTIVSGLKSAVALLSRAAVVLEIFEEGKIPPIWLAAIAFFAGVITTLIGVFLAL